jgi:hypothetical protein
MKNLLKLSSFLILSGLTIQLIQIITNILN